MRKNLLPRASLGGVQVTRLPGHVLEGDDDHAVLDDKAGGCAPGEVAVVLGDDLATDEAVEEVLVSLLCELHVLLLLIAT